MNLETAKESRSLTLLAQIKQANILNQKKVKESRNRQVIEKKTVKEQLLQVIPIVIDKATYQGKNIALIANINISKDALEDISKDIEAKNYSVEIIENIEKGNFNLKIAW